MKQLIESLSEQYPHLNFAAGLTFCWSPAEQTIIYRDRAGSVDKWSLLHEVAHALLEHRAYQTDVELLLLEVAAWHKAQALAREHGFTVDDNHVQDCLDTYRDWLNRRSACPLCGSAGLQHTVNEYRCFNCGARWRVSASRFCRPYRQLNRGQKRTSPTAARRPRPVFS